MISGPDSKETKEVGDKTDTENNTSDSEETLPSNARVTDTLRPTLLTILKTFEDCKWEVEIPGKVFGKSGVEHEFTLLARPQEDPGSAELVATEVLASDSEVQSDKVLTYFAKVADSSIDNRILVASPSLSETGKKLASSFDIVVIETGQPDSSNQSLVRRLIEFLNGIESHRKAEESVNNQPEESVNNQSDKRSYPDIISGILSICSSPIDKSELMSRANLSLKQSNNYVTALEKMGLLKNYQDEEGHEKLCVTEKGKNTLDNIVADFGTSHEDGS